MLSPALRKQLNTEFYTALGLMMRGSQPQFRYRQSWVNYKTGIKDLFLRIHADGKGCYISIDLQHRDAGIRALFWEQLCETRLLLADAFESELTWVENTELPDGRGISRIQTTLCAGNIFDKSMWPHMFQYLRNNLIQFDAFWTDAFDIFKALEE